MNEEGIMARMPHDYYGTSWVSRDWEDIDCKCVGCKYNVNEKCGVPTRAQFNNEAKCEGFEAKLDKGKIDGD